MRLHPRLWGLVLAATLSLSACASDGSGNGPAGSDFDDVGDCTALTAAVSSEKMGLFDKLSDLFQSSNEAKGLEKCAKIVRVNTPSGEAAELLKNGWQTSETSKPQPVIWSPASSSWISQVTDARGVSSIGDAQSIARSPVVFAMPELMARKLGWPNKPIGMRDLRDLCLDPAGWGKFGSAAGLWGGFKLGKTNPNTSTTGQNELLMQDYVAVNKTDNLTKVDVATAAEFSRGLESCVIHYGDTTGNVLTRAYELDQQGKPLGYVSAVAVEETSLINYNLGNPDSHAVKEGEVLTKPKSQMVAVYPSEGSLQSDNPLVVLDAATAPWVTPEQRKAAEAFKAFAVSPAAQKVLGDFGFRAADTSVAPSGLVSQEYGADPSKPTVLMKDPSNVVIAAAKEQWDATRKPSSVLELIDQSGSMGNSVSNGKTRMDIAVESAADNLKHFRPTDEVGVWTFSTYANGSTYQIRPVSPLGVDRERLASDIKTLQPDGGTPLYDAVYDAYVSMKKQAKPGRINAIVILSDGQDESSQRFSNVQELIDALPGLSDKEAADPTPVRVFPIVYSEDASSQDLAKIAKATGGQVFDASDPKRLSLVFKSVINNF